ncbi:hypothetical protein BJ085DRAFT_39529 [Dimargaris cristalligena]|uniref:Uncharacterized protein n=1 Tax=Dimargaris cristalligena TaxID=215637 RepID=A0A4P9ZL91_9FUNG|nr:hypothetical protein BJ085DRAFT_39529 [Dimargaris cristalligena]|eukprot:RKP34037.1 hypothetical protein BJ085DRAFT_39529 [Dimargaris cristalligena]
MASLLKLPRVGGTPRQLLKCQAPSVPLRSMSTIYSHAAEPVNSMPTGVGSSKLLLRTEADVSRSPELTEFNLSAEGYRKSNLYQAVNDAMRIALSTDDTAGKSPFPQIRQ